MDFRLGENPGLIRMIVMVTAEIIGISRHRILRDGEGVTTLVGMAGCPLRCVYCINKDTLALTSRFRVMSAEQLLDTVRKDDVYFRATNGGVTFGGGEPLLHEDFIREFRRICPEVWKVNIETSLNVRTDSLLDLCGSVDCMIVDIKTLNPRIYRRYTGKDNVRMIHNLSVLSENHMQDKVLVRIPLIPNFNDMADVETSVRKLRDMGFGTYKVVRYIKRSDEPRRPARPTEYGKGICSILRHIRSAVAEANGVRLDEEDCPNDKCLTGTCPKCEDYLSRLTGELSTHKNPIY